MPREDNNETETRQAADNSNTLIVESRVNEQLLLIDNDTDYKITDYRSSNISSVSKLTSEFRRRKNVADRIKGLRLLQSTKMKLITLIES